MSYKLEYKIETSVAQVSQQFILIFFSIRDFYSFNVNITRDDIISN